MSALSTEYTAVENTVADPATAIGRIYTDYYGLRENPFAITPDPRYLYMSPRHRDALAHLLFAVKQGGGFVQLTGEVGTGKTTLTRALLSQLPAHVNAAIILNPKQSALEFVQSICDELAVPRDPHATSIKALTDALNNFLLASHARGQRTMVLIDEAQNLDVDVLEQIRLLTNLETPKEKLLQIILVGQPELRLLLDRRDLRQLAQRITARYHLLPLSETETVEMVKHRLAVAGYTQTLFARSALRFIHRASHGVPRLINVICDRALLGAYAENRRTIDRRIVMRAAAEVMGDEPAVRMPSRSRWVALALGVVLIASIAAMATRIYAPETAIVPAQSEDVAPGTAATAAATVEESAPAVVEPAAPVAPAPAPIPVPPPSFAERVNDAGYITDLDTAMANLTALWSRDYRSTSGIVPCDRVNALGLHCFRGVRGTWAQLRRMDHPAVLKLTTAANVDRYALLLGMDNESVILQLNDEQFTLPLAKVETVWRGEYALLWEVPAINARSITSGMQGIAVKWLLNTLNRIDGQPLVEGPTAVFDDALAERVKAFQKSIGLRADGIVGEQTMIHLIAATPDAPIPRLSAAMTP